MNPQDPAVTSLPDSASIPALQVAALHDPPTLQAMPVTFRGTAGDYFGVWIVNTLLTVITLGIWSAWAKVRTNRWFHGHTEINGHCFEYHATPLQILKGRLIAVAALAVITIASYISPLLETLLFLIILMVIPRAINAGLRFNACMTSWRNVRFDFHGSYGRALVLFILMPVAVMFSLGLLAPVYSRQLGQYLAAGYRYGGATFTTTPRLPPMYGALIRGALLLVAAWSPGLLALYAMGYLALPIALMNFYIALAIGAIYYGACVRNEILTQTMIKGGHRLQSRVDPAAYTWIVVTGFLATAATLTLAYPWARVRRYRFLMQSVTLLAAPGLDEFVSNQRSAPSSFGGEFSELEGFASVASL